MTPPPHSTTLMTEQPIQHHSTTIPSTQKEMYKNSNNNSNFDGDITLSSVNYTGNTEEGSCSGNGSASSSHSRSNSGGKTKSPKSSSNRNNFLNFTTTPQTANNTSTENNTTIKPHEFLWRYGGHKVILTGDFDNWQCTHSMTHFSPTIDEECHKIIINLDAKKTWQFKFVVDGIWRCSMDFPTVIDPAGNVNNILYPEEEEGK